MNEKRQLLCHFLAAVAYRTQKALRGAGEDFGEFRAADGVRTPSDLVRHMTSVLGYACTFIKGGEYFPAPLPRLQDEVRRFHETAEELAVLIGSGKLFLGVMTEERMLQGPLSDAMTHAGQLAMLRRLHGAPVPPENFIFAEIKPERLGADQPEPAAPDERWEEAPAGWLPPSKTADRR